MIKYERTIRASELRNTEVSNLHSNHFLTNLLPHIYLRQIDRKKVDLS